MGIEAFCRSTNLRHEDFSVGLLTWADDNHYGAGEPELAARLDLGPGGNLKGRTDWVQVRPSNRGTPAFRSAASSPLLPKALGGAAVSNWCSWKEQVPTPSSAWDLYLGGLISQYRKGENKTQNPLIYTQQAPPLPLAEGTHQPPPATVSPTP